MHTNQIYILAFPAQIFIQIFLKWDPVYFNLGPIKVTFWIGPVDRLISGTGYSVI